MMAEHSMQIESLAQAFDYCDEHGYRLVETYVDDKSGELMMKYDDGKNSISKSKRDIDREDEVEAAREEKILDSTYGVATNYNGHLMYVAKNSKPGVTFQSDLARRMTKEAATKKALFMNRNKNSQYSWFPVHFR
mgnify:CR=1 FL=1